MALVVACALLATGPAGAAQEAKSPHAKRPIPAPYRIAERSGAWWLTTPEGKPFFSLGVCCVTPGDSWLETNPKNAGYAAWKHYPDAVAWADSTLARLKSWGFTTIGGWSDDATLKRSHEMSLPYTVVLHLGASSGAPWWDMWDPKVIATMDAIARDKILPVRDDPHLLGYYTDNEMGWWNAEMFRMTLEQKPTSTQRRMLIAMLRGHYHNDWRALLRDFAPQGADSFAALDRKGILYLRPGGDGIHPIRRFLGMAAARYYALMRQIVRRYDPRGLLLGDRYQSFYYPEVAQAAHRDVDVLSTNVNPGWPDGTLVRYYLETLHTLSGRPVTVGEFYMTSTENRSGNKNDSDGYPVVATQEERAAGFRTAATEFARRPYVVGADWFQYYDEPPHGRGDGENYDMGLVDIEDRPYEEITVAAAALDPTSIHAKQGTPRPDARGGVPPAPPEPLAHAHPMEALLHWDRERGFVPPASSAPTADLTLCWTPDAIYVGLCAMDVPQATYYRNKQVPEIDRMQWSLTPGNRPPLHARLGAGRPPTGGDSRFAVYDLSGHDEVVRGTYVARLPAALFGRERLQPGDKIRLSSTLMTHARAYQMDWSGAFTLAR